MHYTITRFDPAQSIIEVRFEDWPDALAIALTVNADGLLPTGEALDAIIAAAAPTPEEIARRKAIALASNHAELDALVGTTRTCGSWIAGRAPAGLLAEVTARVAAMPDTTPSAEVVI